MGGDIFGKEKAVIDKANAVLKSGVLGDQRAVDGFGALLGSYEKLLKSTRRLVRISDRNEAELNRLARSLETQAEELRIARDVAESATRAKDLFLAAMSHEIRTPMNGVVGMIDLLVRTEMDDDQRDMLATVRDSAFSLLHIIDDILDFSKIEAGKLTLETIPISIRDMVEGVAETLAPNARKKGLQLLTFVDPAIPPSVTGDPVRIRQILFNLGGNAIKFTEDRPETPGTVTIRADWDVAGDRSGTAVRFRIADNGIGIAEDVLPKLFKAFAQAETSTTRRFGGTGLGLSICAGLTEAMGGAVSVDSTLGKGSTFAVTIPVGVASETAENGGDGNDLAGLRVLLVCRTDERKDHLTRYLTHWNADVVGLTETEPVAARASAAAATGKPFDVVVVDTAWGVDGQLAVRDDVLGEPQLAGTGLVLLTDGRRHPGDPALADSITVDGNPLRRASFLTAVAAAAGRASPETRKDDFVAQRIVRKAPTAEDAEAAGQLILVAEDNLTNQDVIRRQLRMLGYTCDVADNGIAALAAWRRKRYGLILTDCQMPEMDGFALTGAIRDAEDAADDRVPIVAITANALKGEAERCLAAGMDGYLTKPLEMDLLQAALDKWLPLEPGDRATTDPTDEGPPPVSAEEAEGPPLGEGPAPSSHPVDATVLKDLFGDDEETFRQILNDFVEPSSSNVAEVHEAYSQRSAAGIAAAAHKLKSSSRAIGANDLADVCLRLEQAGKAGDWEEIDASVPHLDAALKAVTNYIKAL